MSLFILNKSFFTYKHTMKKIIKTKDPVNQPLISLENEKGLEKI